MVNPTRLKIEKVKEFKNFLYRLAGSNKCIICNSTVNLTFHHRDPKSKKYNISDLVYHKKSITIIIKELKKCDLLCEYCHKKIHKIKKGNYKNEQKNYQSNSSEKI